MQTRHHTHGKLSITTLKVCIMDSYHFFWYYQWIIQEMTTKEWNRKRKCFSKYSTSRSFQCRWKINNMMFIRAIVFILITRWYSTALHQTSFPFIYELEIVFKMKNKYFHLCNCSNWVLLLENFRFKYCSNYKLIKM